MAVLVSRIPVEDLSRYRRFAGILWATLLFVVLFVCACLPGNVHAHGYDDAKIDKLIQDVADGKYKPIYSGITLFMVKSTYTVGKYASVGLDKVQGYAFSAMLGVKAGAHTGSPHGAVAGAVGNVLVDGGKDVAMLFLREYLKNPQSVARTIASEAMREGLKAYSTNVAVAKNLEFGEELTREQKRTFAENHVKVQMLPAARDMYNIVRKDNDSPIAENTLANIFEKYQSLHDDSPVSSKVLFIADVLDAIHDAELPLADYEPLNTFYETAAKFNAAAGILPEGESSDTPPDEPAESEDDLMAEDEFPFKDDSVSPIRTPIEVVFKPSKGIIRYEGISENTHTGKKSRELVVADQTVTREGDGLRVDLVAHELPNMPAGVKTVHLQGKMTDKGWFQSMSMECLDANGKEVDSAEIRQAKHKAENTALSNFNMRLSETPVMSGDVLSRLDISRAMEGEMNFDPEGNEDVSFVVIGMKRVNGVELILAVIPEGTVISGTARAAGASVDVEMRFAGHVLMDHRKGVAVHSDLEMDAELYEASTGTQISFSVHTVADFEQTGVAEEESAPEERASEVYTAKDVLYVKTDAGWNIIGRLVDDWERPAKGVTVALEAVMTGERLAAKTRADGSFTLAANTGFTFLQGIQEMTIHVGEACVSRLLVECSQGDPKRAQPEIDGREFLEGMTAVMGEVQGRPDHKGLLAGLGVGGGTMTLQYVLSLEEYERIMGPEGDGFLGRLRSRLKSFVAYYIEAPGVFAGITSVGDELCVRVQLPVAYMLPETVPGS